MDVNKAFEKITGYSRNEVIGRSPKILKSGKHDTDFYRGMWQSLMEHGHWRGEIWNRRKNGALYPEWLNISTTYSNNRSPEYYVAVFSDITSIKRSERELNHMAHHDPLTDLPNRLLFNSQLETAIIHAKISNTVFAVLFIDLDRFKNINDSLEHKAGDDLLQQIAERIRETIRLDDTVARISGDQFVVILENIKNVENTAMTVDKIMNLFRKLFLLEQHEVHITESIGISIYPDNGDSVADLLRNANTAMYRSKKDGRNTYQFFTHEMTSNSLERIIIEKCAGNGT